jgi:hypothetical protein
MHACAVLIGAVEARGKGDLQIQNRRGMPFGFSCSLQKS